MKKILSFSEFNIIESNIHSFADSLNEAEFKHINKDEHKIKLAIKDVEKKSRLKANRDKPLEYDQISLNKIMLSKVLGREKLGKEHQDAWKKLKKEYRLKESVNEAKVTKKNHRKRVFVKTMLSKSGAKSVENVIPKGEILYVSYTNYKERATIIKTAERLGGYTYDADGRSTNAPRILGVSGYNWISFITEGAVNEGRKFKGPFNKNVIQALIDKFDVDLKFKGKDGKTYGVSATTKETISSKNMMVVDDSQGKGFEDVLKYTDIKSAIVEGKVNEGLSSSDIKKVTAEIKKYVNKLGKGANGTADEVASEISKLLKWPISKIMSLTDYLIKMNGGSEEIIFETVGTINAPIQGEAPEEYPEIALEKDNKYLKEIILLLKELYTSALDNDCDATRLKETLIPKYKDTKFKINITEDGDLRLDSFGKYPDVHINLPNMKKGNHTKSSIKEEIRSQIKKLHERLPGIPSISQISSFSSEPNLPA